MQERISSVIGIYRGQKGIIAVPITPSSIRRFQLMEEDFVRLDFALDSPIHFAIGDYIQDDIFGRFVITKEQVPKYNSATGGYEYQLQFDAPYMAWANRIFMLTTGVLKDAERREASWTLTAKLADHVEQIIANLAAIGQTYTSDIRATAKHAGEVRCISYDGVSILDAIKMMAEEYECEWWVTGTVIHFGKCEDTSQEELLFSIGEHVERMTISDNRNTFASKIFVYGSTKNIPSTYRKKLSFTYEEYPVHGSGLYKPSKGLTSEMFSISAKADIGIPDNDFRHAHAYLEAAAVYDITFPRVMSGVVTVVATEVTGMPRLAISVKAYEDGGTATTLKMVVIEGTATTKQGVTRVSFDATEILALEEVLHFTMHNPGNLNLELTSQMSGVIYQVEYEVDYYEDATNLIPTGRAEIEVNASAPSRVIECTNGKTIRFNPNGSSDSEQHQIFAFVDGPAEEGEVLTIDDEGVYNVPSAFYVGEYDDPGSLARIGSNRLRMPITTGDSIMMEDVSEENAVEKVIVFDDIYPDGRLQVTSVESKNRTDYTEFEGEREKAAWKWKEYTIEAELLNGSPFRFRYEYILPNVTLQVKFLTPEDIDADAEDYTGKCLLAGMTFDVRFNRAAGSYTIVRNNDYGAMLPNETLYPQEGDPFVLVGWNSRAIAGLGLIEDAEERLEAKAVEYMAAMEEGQFTFDCEMMSDFMFGLMEICEWHDSHDLHIQSSDGVLIYVRGGAYTNYLIPTAGYPVCIRHRALKEDKHSRVIGYELKFDKPYDSPKYTIGETERYSRLAQLEKQITSISNG